MSLEVNGIEWNRMIIKELNVFNEKEMNGMKLSNLIRMFLNKGIENK